jgi:hypothetical protein
MHLWPKPSVRHIAATNCYEKFPFQRDRHLRWPNIKYATLLLGTPTVLDDLPCLATQQPTTPRRFRSAAIFMP